MRIFFDVDGVLFDAYTKIEQMALFHFADMNLKPPLIKAYDFKGTDPMVAKYIKRQFENPEVMAPHDMFYPVALEIDNLCKQHEVYIITSRKYHKKEMTYEAFKSFPHLTGIIFVKDVKDKWLWCRDMKVDILVEDCYECVENVLDGTVHTSCIVIRQPHNKKFEEFNDRTGLSWANNIHEAVDMIKERAYDI
jgi:uncharacterized HAD superfamily protein